MLRLIIIILIVLSGVSVFSGTTDPNVPDKEYVEYGKNFDYIGQLCGKYEDGTRFCASAVAIDDHHILTAAHVVQHSVSCILHLENKEFCIDKITIHNNFDKDKFGIADIAIGYSKDPIGLNFYPSLYENDDEEGKVCSISGYGFYGTFNTGAKRHDNKRRSGLNIIDNIQQDMLVCSSSRPTDKNKTSLEFLIASGDSGGGLIIDDKLAGINSCIMSVDKSPSGKYNEESGHTRVSKFIVWINENKKQ